MTCSPFTRAALGILSVTALDPYRYGFRAFREAFQRNPNHPIRAVWDRMRAEIDPSIRRRFMRNVVRTWLVRGWRMRRRLDFQFPPVLLLSVTDACNYQCKGCYAVGHEKGHEMDVALVERLVREAAAHGTNYFVLLGGEPFLWPHLLPVLQSHPEAWFQIYTNGSKIDRGTAAELRKKANVQVMISLEGLRGHTDARRGPGAYDNCLMAMDNLRLERVPFGVGVTCYRSNLAEVVSDAFVEEMLSRGCLFIWYFWYMPYGDLPEFEEVLTSEDRAVLRDGIIRIRNSYPVIAADQIADCGAVGGCTARAGLALHVTASGLVEPCAQMHFSDASVGEAGIGEVLGWSELLRRIRTPAANPGRACYLQDCCAELLEVIRCTGARDNTSGWDTKSLAEMASRTPAPVFSASDAEDAYAPLIEFFFEMICPKRTGRKEG